MQRDQGYEDDLFINPVADNLHCPICFNVLKEPMQCENEHYYCRPCITRHLQESRTCPTCLETLTLDTLRPPSRFVRQIISQLKIRCKYMARGCNEVMELELLEAHVRKCNFTPVSCSNHGCSVIVNKNDLEHHEKVACSFRLVNCEICGECVIYGKEKMHCFVTRKEMDAVKMGLNELKDQVCCMKNEVMNLGQEMKRELRAIKSDIEYKILRQLEVRNTNTRSEKISPQKTEGADERQGSLMTVNQSLDSRIVCQEQSSNLKDIIIAGGGNDRGLKTVEKFIWSSKTWVRLKEMTSTRWYASSFIFDGQMIVSGGYYTDDMESMSLKEEGRGWKILPTKLPQEIWRHVSLVYEDNLLVIGGQNRNVLDGIYEVDPAAQRFSKLICHMPQGRIYHGAQLYDSKVIIVGGTPSTFATDCLDDVLLYDISKNECRPLAPLPYAVCEMATVLWKDNIIILGGWDRNANASKRVIMYNISTESSKMLPTMTHKRAGCTATIMGNLIVVMGGFNNEEGCLDSVEYFDMDRFHWKGLPRMNEKRNNATAVSCVM